MNDRNQARKEYAVEDQKFLQESLMKALAWGTGIVILFVGWILTSDPEKEIFSLLDCAKTGWCSQCKKAVGLMIVALFLFPVWVGSICTLRRRCKDFPFRTQEIGWYLVVVCSVAIVIILLSVF